MAALARPPRDHFWPALLECHRIQLTPMTKLEKLQKLQRLHDVIHARLEELTQRQYQNSRTDQESQCIGQRISRLSLQSREVARKAVAMGVDPHGCSRAIFSALCIFAPRNPSHKREKKEDDK